MTEISERALALGFELAGMASNKSDALLEDAYAKGVAEERESVAQAARDIRAWRDKPPQDERLHDLVSIGEAIRAAKE